MGGSVEGRGDGQIPAPEPLPGDLIPSGLFGRPSEVEERLHDPGVEEGTEDIFIRCCALHNRGTKFREEELVAGLLCVGMSDVSGLHGCIRGLVIDSVVVLCQWLLKADQVSRVSRDEELTCVYHPWPKLPQDLPLENVAVWYSGQNAASISIADLGHMTGSCNV